ncbi:phosphoglycerate kinase [Mycoplasma simbae]|uniref:phosphoglycerate kinase n=1 Tax=Mycoplasma simbae TaxID=36744 RepID=UPI00049593BF|nr:phosphoglycerate kinase [Mycoplasma simbae]
MKKTIKDINLNNKKVLIRVDFNVPIKNGIIQSNERIEAALQTIKYALAQNAKVILLSHLSRIKTYEDKAKKSLQPIALELAKLLGQKVYFSAATSDDTLKDAINQLQPGEVILVENTRYEDLNDKAESKNAAWLGQKWASLADVFINDAFATAHRSHASNVGISQNITESGVGFLVEKELNAFDSAFASETKPFVAVVGGAKVKDKISYLTKLSQKADQILIGGAMAYTFLKAQGYQIGKSLVEDDQIDFAKELIANSKAQLFFPLDHALVNNFEDVEPTYSQDQNIAKDKMGIDIGPKTIDLYSSIIAQAKLIYWNGPLGVFELGFGEQGTKSIGQAIVNSNAYSIIGGGDTISASEKFGFKANINHVSTGGGASQQYLLEHSLPAIDAIQDK